MEHVDHILIVDDDREIRELVGNYLKKNGLRTSIVADGRQMRAFLEANSVDLIVLDIMMPGDDGLLLCRELRAGKHRNTPVLMLTARNDETDRIIGLEMGADDYLTKPFSARELLARINAVLRRTRMLPPNLTISESSRLLGFGQWRLDTTARHLLDSEGTLVALSGAEYRLLRVFLDHPQRVLSREQLLNLTQGREADIFDRSIDLLVSRLRQRLGDDKLIVAHAIRSDHAGGQVQQGQRRFNAGFAGEAVAHTEFAAQPRRHLRGALHGLITLGENTLTRGEVLIRGGEQPVFDFAVQHYLRLSKATAQHQPDQQCTAFHVHAHAPWIIDRGAYDTCIAVR